MMCPHSGERGGAGWYVVQGLGVGRIGTHAESDRSGNGHASPVAGPPAGVEENGETPQRRVVAGSRHAQQAEAGGYGPVLPLGRGDAPVTGVAVGVALADEAGPVEGDGESSGVSPPE